jgi:hypothetical protein
MPKVHRHSDPRICGASTIVAGQDTVYANNLLVSVNGDPNSHGAGALSAGSDQVYAGSILVVNHTPDGAAPDALCPPLNGTHCGPSTAGGSPDVYVGD